LASATGSEAYTYGVPSQNDDLHLDLTFTGSQGSYTRPVAISVAAVLILFIILTMTTSISSKILPMSDEYLLVMIPSAPDGTEPLALKSLMYDAGETMISVNGSIMNRTAETMPNVLAVVEMQDTTGRFPQTVETPVQPQDLPPQATGTFSTMATLQGKPGAFVVKFRFADGPFIPHRDEREPQITITPQQPPEEIK
jgi:hypothetical protein